MRNLLAVSILISVVLLAGCRMELPEQGSEGERLYAAKCALCHQAFHPKTLSAEEWAARVKQTEFMVEETGIREPLSDTERALILDYLERHSKERVM